VSQLNLHFNQTAQRKRNDDDFIWFLFLLLLLEQAQYAMRPTAQAFDYTPKIAFGR